MDSDRTFFITTITAARLPIFRRDSAARLLIDTLAHYRDQRKFLVHEFVIMPDHIHALLTPAPEISLERAMQLIKGGFSFRLKSRGPAWQASFTNHRILDLDDFEHHREYIRMNPVRARLAASPEAYPYSSAAGLMRMDPVPQGLKPIMKFHPNATLKAALPRVVPDKDELRARGGHRLCRCGVSEKSPTAGDGRFESRETPAAKFPQFSCDI